MKNLSEQRRHVSVWQPSRMFGLPCAIALIAAFIIGGPAAILPSAWAQTFSDNTFNDANWDIFPEIFIDNDLLGSGTVDAFQVGEGGNPGAFRQIQQALTVADDSATILGFHRNTNAVYVPSINGAIDTIDFSVDAITFSNGSSLAVGPALMQNGGIYFSPATNTARTWSTASFTNLTVESFFNLDFFSPNFSENGSPITFGFVFSSSGFAELSNVEFSGGVDNWSVTVTPHAAGPPPEPETDPETAPGAVPDLKGKIREVVRTVDISGRDRLEFTVKVKNRGTVKTASQFKVKAHLSNDGVFDGGKVDPKIAKWKVEESLLSGDSITLTGSAEFEESVAGKFLIIRVDFKNTVVESREDNNVKSREIPK